MKIKNLFLSISLFCLALLVLLGAGAPVMQFRAQAASLQVASANENSGKKYLFDEEGNYTVDIEELKEAVLRGTTFEFFGYEWQAVFVNEDKNVVTFWMAEPYTKSVFNKVQRFANGIYLDGSNVWVNGYSENIWNNEGTPVKIGASEIYKFLAVEAERILTDDAYAKYADKVVKGAVHGSNEVSLNGTLVQNLYSSRNGGVIIEPEEENTLTAYYGLGDAALWLPSKEEIKNIWQVHENVIRWTDNTNNGGYAWLRTPDAEDSDYVSCVRSKPNSQNGSLYEYIHISNEYGVRPAIHMNLGEISPLATEEKSWFNEDWLKILFIVVCVLGLLGVALVITAVVVKSNKK